MKRAIRTVAVLTACTAFTASAATLEASGRPAVDDSPAPNAPVRADVAWEPNVGQAPEDVIAIGRGAGTTVLADRRGALVLVGDGSVRMTWRGAGGGGAAFGPKLRGVSHYLVGSDPSAWHRRVPHHVDVSFSGSAARAAVTWTSRGGRPAYDFDVPAGVDVSSVEVEFGDTAGELALAPDGSLRVPVAGGTLRHGAPRAFEATPDGPREAPARWEVRGAGRAGFAVERSRADCALLVDPQIDFATFLGGSSDDVSEAIAVRADHKVVVAGRTASSNFPTRNEVQASLRGGNDAFVTLFDPDAREIVWSTYLGGSSNDVALALAAAGDEVLVGGSTRSYDFPVVNALDSTYAWNSSNYEDAFLARIGADGSTLRWSTFIGDTGAELVSSIVLAPDASIRAAGRVTYSPGFVATATATAGSTFNDGAWIANFASDGSRRDWMFVLAPSAAAPVRLAIAPGGDCVVSGWGYFNWSNGYFPATPGSFGPTQIGDGQTQDAFVARIKSDGTGLRWAGLLGGGRNEDMGGVAVDAAGNVYVAGSTLSDDFPVTPGAYQTKQGGPHGVVNPPSGYGDAFLAKIAADGSALMFSTYFGGQSADTCTGFALDADGVPVLVGTTSSGDFPILCAPPGTWSWAQSAYAARISPDGAHLLQAMPWGYGREYGKAVALDGKRILLAGTSSSPEMPWMGAPQSSPTAGGSVETIVARWDPSPSADTDLSATLLSADTARLRFTAAPDAALHRVERRRGTGPWETVATLPPDAGSPTLQYDDAGLVAPDPYRYRIIPMNDVGDGRPTNEVRVETVPDTPVDMAVSAISAQRVVLSWTNPSLQALWFEVLRSVGADAPVAVGFTIGTAFEDRSVWPDRTYSYSVRAHSFYAVSAPSMPVSASTTQTVAIALRVGSIRLSQRAGHDAVSLRGTIAALPAAADEAPVPLDFVHSGLVMRLGDHAGVELLDALPDDTRWRRNGRLITWTSSKRSRRGTQFRFDPATGAFDLRVQGVDLGAGPTGPITIVVDSMLHSGRVTNAWLLSRHGYVLNVPADR